MTTSTAVRQRRTRARQWHLGAFGRTALLWTAGTLAGVALVGTAVSGLRPADVRANDLRDHSLPAMAALSDAAQAASAGQTAFIQAVDTTDLTVRTTAITTAEAAGRTQDGSWNRYQSLAVGGEKEEAWQETYEAASTSARQLAASLLSLSADDPTRATVLADERRSSAQAIGALAALQSDVYAPRLLDDAGVIDDSIHRSRGTLMVLGAVLAVAFAALAIALLRSARRDQHRLDTEAHDILLTVEQADLEGSLQRGLELAPSEDATYGIVTQALSMVAHDVAAELLVADSSHGRFRQALATEPTADVACSVGCPSDCPASNTGQTRAFENSTQLDACPFLRDQERPAWAICVPVSIGGRATGVVHAQGLVGQPVPERMREGLELVARKAGERIGSLRILARTEAEAHADPLTGLPNRRALEAEMDKRRILDGPYVVAFADLDHFKEINDVYGHDTGDRALRLFARVLRDNLRPTDLFARYGGEEFLAVLPDCSPTDALIVVERVRAELARTLASATVPPFTITIGLAPAFPGDPLSEVIARADAAMLRGKTDGRDRVLLAGELVDDDLRNVLPVGNPE